MNRNTPRSRHSRQRPPSQSGRGGYITKLLKLKLLGSLLGKGWFQDHGRALRHMFSCACVLSVCKVRHFNHKQVRQLSLFRLGSPWLHFPSCRVAEESMSFPWQGWISLRSQIENTTGWVMWDIFTYLAVTFV